MVVTLERADEYVPFFKASNRKHFLKPTSLIFKEATAFEKPQFQQRLAVSLLKKTATFQ